MGAFGMPDGPWEEIDAQMGAVRRKGHSLLGMIACWLRNDSVAPDRQAKKQMLGKVDLMRKRLDEVERIVKSL